MQWSGSIRVVVHIHQTQTKHSSNIELANQFYGTLTVVSCASLLFNVNVWHAHQCFNLQVSHFISRQQSNNEKQKYIVLVVFFSQKYILFYCIITVFMVWCFIHSTKKWQEKTYIMNINTEIHYTWNKLHSYHLFSVIGNNLVWSNYRSSRGLNWVSLNLNKSSSIFHFDIIVVFR